MKKYLAAIKYLFFPFLMAHSTESDFSKMFHNQQTITIALEAASFTQLGVNEGFWKMEANSEKAQQHPFAAFFFQATQAGGNNCAGETNAGLIAGNELLILDEKSSELIN